MTWKVFITTNPTDFEADEIAVRVEADSILEAIAEAQTRVSGTVTKAQTHEDWKRERDELRRLRKQARLGA